MPDTGMDRDTDMVDTLVHSRRGEDCSRPFYFTVGDETSKTKKAILQKLNTSLRLQENDFLREVGRGIRFVRHILGAI